MTVFKCRNCGQAYRMEPLGEPKRPKAKTPKRGRGPRKQQTHTTYESAIYGDAPGISVAEATRETPLWEPTIRAMVAVPAARAAVMGLVLGVGAGVVILLCGESLDLDWKWGLAAGIIVWVLATFVFVGGSEKQIAVRERIVSTEDDEYRTRSDTLRIEVAGDRSLDLMDLGGMDWRKMQDWASEVVKGRPMSVSVNTGKAGPFTRPEFDSMMDRLITHGWVVHVGGNVGRCTTPKGRVMLGKLARGEFEVLEDLQ
jgi:hypothetical protein